MINQLSTIESALQTELLANAVEDAVQDFMATAKTYGLPTDEADATTLLIQVAQRKLKDLQKIDDISEVTF